MSSSNTISSIDDFKKDAEGIADRWDAEMASADKEIEKWAKDARKLVDRFRDHRTTAGAKDGVRLNLFSSNVTTMRNMLYGQMPSVEAKRRYDDYADDAARVAGTMLQRMLNNDIQRDSDQYNDILRYALDDRLITGLGTARVRYVASSRRRRSTRSRAPTA